MKESKRELAKRLRERRRYGGISGGEEKSPLNYSCVQAELGGVGVIFDSEIYKHDVQTESDNSLTMHSVKAEDGREAYFEVDQDGKLYAFLSFGLNVEIWSGLLVIGARSYKDDKAEKRALRGR